jgi:hypothetical protein
MSNERTKVNIFKVWNYKGDFFYNDFFAVCLEKSSSRKNQIQKQLFSGHDFHYFYHLDFTNFESVYAEISSLIYS